MKQTSHAIPALIAVDWGSTHLRAALIIDGELVAKASSADGIRNLQGRSCADALFSVCGEWKLKHPDARILASGMVGAREGWVELPYVHAPCSIDDLIMGIVSVESAELGEVLLIPGVRVDTPDGTSTDVMRGEEVQIFGLLATMTTGEDAVFCLPGTHSKWVRCRAGRIEDFQTWFTGEAYELLTTRSLVSGDGTRAAIGSDAFYRGLHSAEIPGGLLRQIFIGRTHVLSERLQARELQSYVSGLLLAHELRGAREFAPNFFDHYPSSDTSETQSSSLILVGDSMASDAVAVALKDAGVPFVRPTIESHLEGIIAIQKKIV